MFTAVPVFKIQENVFDLIGKQWMLITAGKKDSYNTMTASWGGFGFLWNVPVVFIFIRPQRYTYLFTEANTTFTLCFFEDEFKNILTYCGSHSGRDVDKVKECSLTAAETEHGSIYFEQAKLVLECTKLYYDDIDPAHFIEPGIQRNYPENDYHRMYIGKVIKCLVRK
jgi:flavin reductase (DIM6/NTAB) family NADH-FMN oxidoreductase RutF